MLLALVTAALVFPLTFGDEPKAGILYPQDSESRETKSLDGIWNFRLAPRLEPELGFQQAWFAQDLSQTGAVVMMPVPSSYNDVTQEKSFRDHVGWAWYDRSFWLPKDWQVNKRIFLRVGAANYHAIVYVNGRKVMEHSGGHLPFLVELEKPQLDFKRLNRITIAINNTLTYETVPQGSVVWQEASRYPKGYFTLNYNFDFFNYAGIHRSVLLYTTPTTFIDDILVIPSVNGTTGHLWYSVQTRVDPQKSRTTTSWRENESVMVELQNKEGQVVAVSDGKKGLLEIPHAKLWWPFTMVEKDRDAGYLHTLVVTVRDMAKNLVDVYRLKVGIRSVKWTKTQFLINDKPFYFRGFGRHEDYNIRGKGMDDVMVVKDHNLVKWTGANSYRTSHYPYAEEIMDVADTLGIVIIDEAPAVAINGFGNKLLENHKEQIRELVERDKNRASVVMWSVTNEPQSQKEAADSYFKEIFEWTRLQDPTRPVTAVVAQDYSQDKVAKYTDILCINRYFSWYSDAGHLEVVRESITEDVLNWIRTHEKPLIVTEYGADTVAGLHSYPEMMFTEDYQTKLMDEHFKAFDYLRQNTSLIGEHIWNFADFMTAQGVTRVTGNRKGIFTRDRQPKASANLLRVRYHKLAQESDKYPVPADLKDNFLLSHLW